ncbi:MAG: hypothetical protein HY900_10615 [Deltaproteobacteria bacterium]|nr:hypothetical protein [Deltaproteobacteria bacterium]
MTNLTITVDESVLQRARIRALEQGTSVNAVLRELLEGYANARQEQVEALEDLLALSQAATSRGSGARWTRDELHER